MIFFLLIFFFPSYNYFLSCVTCHNISGSLRKKVCFRYLANEEFFASLGYFFLVGKSTEQDIVRESGKAIWKVLQPIYITVPASEEWLRIADEFNEICKMPNYIGSRDGQYCLIRCPPNAVFLYFNYKSFHLTKLLCVADANCCSTLIDVGAHGLENDNSVFSNSSSGKAFSSGELNVPPVRNIPGTSVSIPLYFVGDEASPLKPRE